MDGRSRGDRPYHRGMEIREALSPELVARIQKGVQEAYQGKTHDLGDFSQHLDDETEEPEPTFP